MTVAIVLPVIVAAGLSLLKIRDNEREAALRGLRETARATSLIVDREIQGSLSTLRALGHSKSLDTQDFEAFYEEASALDRKGEAWTVLYDAAGRQLVNTARPYGTPLPTAAPVSVKVVAEVLGTQKTVVTDLLPGPLTRKLLIGVHIPVSPNGRHESMVVAHAIAVEYWLQTVLQAPFPPGWIVGVIDRNGKFIARSHKAEELLGQSARPELVKAAAQAPDGLIQHHTVEGIEVYDAFTHSSLTGWTIAVAAPVELVEGPVRKALQLAMAGMLLAMGVAAVAATAFGRRIVGSVAQARVGAVALGRGHKPAAKPGGLVELNQLNLALVDAGALLDSERKSRVAAESERERLLQKETTAREAAQADSAAKDKFLAMLGHELRNPLAAMSGAITLLDKGLDKEKTARYVGMLRRQNNHLEHIVDDLLDVSRLLAGKITLDRQPINLSDCVDQCVEGLLASGKSLGHQIKVQAVPVWVQGDSVRIEQILCNLITNALKFSPPGSPIEVELQAAEGRAQVQVRDIGAGISAELLPHVFDPFVQGPAPAKRSQMGLGIGLALVEELVGLHGGEVSAASKGAGQGSTFSFWLPSIALPPPSAVPGAAISLPLQG